MEWSEDAIAQLRALWTEGHSTAEIGRRMGVTKNAVVGKAHRLKLSARPSPIRHERQAEPTPRAARPRKPTVPQCTASPDIPVAAPVPARSILRPVPTSAWGRVSPCCWPIGEPGTATFRFCDADTLPNKPYCDTHAQLAYVRVKDRRDNAA